MSSERPVQSPTVDAAERAARVRAMLTRWRAEEMSAEPDWEIEDIEPMRLEPKLRSDMDG